MKLSLKKTIACLLLLICAISAVLGSSSKRQQIKQAPKDAGRKKGTICCRRMYNKGTSNKNGKNRTYNIIPKEQCKPGKDFQIKRVKFNLCKERIAQYNNKTSTSKKS